MFGAKNMISQLIVNRPLIFLFISVTLITGCRSDEDARAFEQPAENVEQPLSYSFDRPSHKYELPVELSEISGIARIDDTHLAAIEDESGVLYVLDLGTGTIAERRKFGKNGDYEDLVLLGDTAFVLDSGGNLYEIVSWRSNEASVVKHDTGLSTRYDTEGLAYDPNTGNLLIAAKEYAGEGLDDHRAIYAYDYKARKRIERPVYTISFDEIAPYIRAGTPSSIVERLRALLEARQYEFGFKPSALAFHPHTGQLYVISSVTRAIVVLSSDGSLQHVHLLPERFFAQPEGMVFLPNGDLLISNEAVNDVANVLHFTYSQS